MFHSWEVTPWDKVIGLGETYPTTPNDRLWLKNYLFFPTKLVIKPRGVDLQEILKNHSEKFHIICHQKKIFIEIMQKNDFKISNNNQPSPKEPQGRIPNVLKIKVAVYY